MAQELLQPGFGAMSSSPLGLPAPSSGREEEAGMPWRWLSPIWRGRQALLTQVFPKATRFIRLVAQDHHATLIKDSGIKLALASWTVVG